MEHLFTAWGRVAAQMKAAERILLLSDYDGTLTPIVERPELACLSERMRHLLQALARQRRFTVGIISGRALSDLKSRVEVRGIVYAGNHGLEIEGPGLNFVNPLAEEVRPVLRALYLVLSRTLGVFRGVLVEDKGLTLSVHHRLVASDETSAVRNILERVTATPRALGKIRITPGKKVYEVRPAVAWDKGKAIALLLERYGKGKALPIFLGDDLTDEDGFRAVQKQRGIAVFVGDEGESAAGYYLSSPEEVETLLGRLAS